MIAGCGQKEVASTPQPSASTTGASAGNADDDGKKPDTEVTGSSNQGTQVPENKTDKPTSPTPENNANAEKRPPMPELPKLDKPESVATGKEWKKTSVVTKDLINSIAKATANMRDTQGRADISFQNYEGNGTMSAYYRIQDPSTYQLDLPNLIGMPVLSQITANGMLKQSFHGGKFTKAVKLDFRSFYSSIKTNELAMAWTTDFVPLMFRGLIDRNDGWQTLLTAFGDPKGNYTFTTQQRDMTYQGHVIRNYRFLINRKAAAAKKEGKLEMEIVVDGTRYIPVTVRVDATDTKGNVFRANWSAQWNFKQTFSPQQFELRNI